MTSGLNVKRRTHNQGVGELDMVFLLDGSDQRRDAITWAYRLFLDRNPESDAAVADLLGSADTRRLRNIFLTSAEFAGRSAGEAAPPATVPLDHPANRVDVHLDRARGERLRKHVASTWTQLGNEAPHWSVLSDEAFRPDRIADSEADFYASGEQDVTLIEAILARHGIVPADTPRCFEFGCGLGRVTVPLAARFSQVTGCDISTSHLALAQRRITALGVPNIRLVHATADDLGMAEPFDLWFSRIVLQHNPPPVMRAILDRAFALLAPGGVAIFQVPTYAEGYAFKIEPYLAGIAAHEGVEMHCLPQAEIFAAAGQAGLVPIEVREEFSAGPSRYWISNMFVFRRLR